MIITIDPATIFELKACVYKASITLNATALVSKLNSSDMHEKLHTLFEEANEELNEAIEFMCEVYSWTPKFAKDTFNELCNEGLFETVAQAGKEKAEEYVSSWLNHELSDNELYEAIGFDIY